MKLIVIVLLALAGASNATFRQLKETCRTSQGLGICVQSELCCTAVGGTRGDSIALNSRSNEVKEVDITIKHSDQHIRAARSLNDAVQSLKTNKLSARAAELTAFPDELQERQTAPQSFDCSYGGLCCVLPTFSDYDCSTCGLWGDGVRTKVTTPRPVQLPPVTTTNTPQQKKILPRIVSGTDAPRNRWCWQVGILDANGLVCGGALIARNWVISAAHCVAGRFLDEIIVVLGMYDFVHSDPSASVWYHNPTGAIIHYAYDPSNYNNDIVLLRIPDAPCGEPGVCTVCLGGPVTFVPVTTTTATSSTVTTTTTTTSTPTTTYSYGASYFNPLTPNFRPQDTLAKIANQISASIGGNGGNVVLPDGSISTQRNPYDGLVCVITGWGSTGTSHTAVAPVLQQAYQQIITPQQCESDFERLGVPEAKINLPDSSFCTRGLTLTESSCVGDGGSPLVCQSHADHSWSLWGVIILGSNMCMPGAENGPTISINVGNYLGWIRNAVQGQLPSVDTTSGRNAYKIPLCGINFLRSSDPVTGGCPVNLHVAGQTGVRARGLLVTGGQPF